MKKLFCERMRAARGDRSQRVIAGLLGIPQQNWQRYESGVSEPGLGLLHDVCVKLGVSADWLLGLTEERRAAVSVRAPSEERAEESGAGRTCEVCARKDAVIASLAESLRALTAAGGKEKGGAE